MSAFIDFHFFGSSPSSLAQAEDSEQAIDQTFETAASADEEQDDDCCDDTNHDTGDGTTTQSAAAVAWLRSSDDRSVGPRRCNVSLGGRNDAAVG